MDRARRVHALRPRRHSDIAQLYLAWARDVRRPDRRGRGAAHAASAGTTEPQQVTDPAPEPAGLPPWLAPTTRRARTSSGDRGRPTFAAYQLLGRRSCNLNGDVGEARRARQHPADRGHAGAIRAPACAGEGEITSPPAIPRRRREPAANADSPIYGAVGLARPTAPSATGSGRSKNGSDPGRPRQDPARWGSVRPAGRAPGAQGGYGQIGDTVGAAKSYDAFLQL